MRERGCEVLAGAINSQDNQEEYGKRALALSDMLVKVWDPVMTRFIDGARDLQVSSPSSVFANTHCYSVRL